MANRQFRGFTLIELMFVILIMGALIVLAIPSLSGYNKAYKLRSAAEDIAAQLNLARQKAISTDSLQTVVFQAGYQGSDYHTLDGSQAGRQWSLPRGITYYGTPGSYRMDKNGRCLDSGLIVLQDSRGLKDTISVLGSGLVVLR